MSPVVSPEPHPEPPPSAPPTRAALWALSWPFVGGLMVIVGVTLASVTVLMGLRVHATGQDLWSLGRKDATIHLLRFASTHNEQSLRDHDQALKVIDHFRLGREAMARGDSHTATAEWMRAGVPAEDVTLGIWGYHLLGWTPPYQRLLTQWVRSEWEISQFRALREQVVTQVREGSLDKVRLDATMQGIHDLDRRIAALERTYIHLLTELSHRVYRLVVGINIALSLLLIAGVLWRTRYFLQARGRVHSLLAGERRRAAVTLNSIADAVVSTDAAGQVVFANAAARKLGSGLAQGAFDAVMPLVGAGAAEPASALTPDVLRGAVDGVRTHDEDCVRRSDGPCVPVTWVAAPIRAASGQPADGAVIVLRDVTRERELLQHMTWLADHDPLTELPNRRVMERRLTACIERGAAQADEHAALLFIDLDQFKVVNDTCGHSAGDELLCQVARIVQRKLRPGDLLTRMGGDEFGVLLAPRPMGDAEQLAHRICRAVAAMTYAWGERRFSPTVSIGLVHLTPGQWQLASAFSAADVTCYVAKDRGRNRVEIYHPDNEQMVTRFGEMSWVQRLHSALTDNRFHLYAQPIRALQGDAGAPHVELLLRLTDESGGLIAPGAFIPAAERFGLMPMLDRWVVDHALTLIARRLRAGELDARALFSINLSGSSFGQESFLGDVKRMIAAHQVPHRMLCFEITETQAVENYSQAIRFITELRALGCAFALDDFGAGMSSFNYIKHLPVNYLKIDGMFVRDMTTSPVDRAIVEMCTHLARAMGVQTVGEFAETQAVIDALHAAGVDHAQGWGVGRPEPFS